jgi:hypothetical protein
MLGKNGKGLRAAEVRFVSFGIEDAIKVLENALIDADAIKPLTRYRDKLLAWAEALDVSSHHLADEPTTHGSRERRRPRTPNEGPCAVRFNYPPP